MNTNIFGRMFRRFVNGEASPVEPDQVQTEWERGYAAGLNAHAQGGVVILNPDGPMVAHGTLSAEEQQHITEDDTPKKQAISLLYEALAMARGESMSKRGMSPSQLELAITKFLSEHDRP